MYCTNHLYRVSEWPLWLSETAVKKMLCCFCLSVCLFVFVSHLVSHSIAHLVAVIVKRDFAVEIQWNELNQFILQHWSSSEPAHKQVSLALSFKACLYLSSDPVINT